MSKIQEARLKQLDRQLKDAVIESDGDVYEVFVPMAVREHNTVKAKNQTEAKEKVKAVLAQKIKNMPDKKGQSAKLDVDSLKSDNKASESN